MPAETARAWEASPSVSMLCDIGSSEEKDYRVAGVTIAFVLEVVAFTAAAATAG